MTAQELFEAGTSKSNPAKCAFNLTDEQKAERRQKHEAAGRKLVGTTRCICGGHDRDMWQ